MKTSRLRRLIDLTILVVAVLGVLYYLPKLNHMVSLTEDGADEVDWDPRYPHAVRVLGLVPMVGSLAMLVPCLSFFSAPVLVERRILLGIVCCLPLGLALYGTTVGIEKLFDTYLQLGFIFSLGVWIFGLPIVIANISFLEMGGRIKQALGLGS